MIGSIYFKSIKRDYLKHIPFGVVLLNFIFQRVFRVNSKLPHSVHYTSRINGAKNLIYKCNKVKTSLAVSGGCYFSCHSAKITIGANTIFSNNVSIVSANHDINNRDKFNAQEVNIGENCWIGVGAVILPGVTLGDNVVVGANSVVTNSFEKNVVIGGNPARVIKKVGL